MQYFQYFIIIQLLIIQYVGQEVLYFKVFIVQYLQYFIIQLLIIQYVGQEVLYSKVFIVQYVGQEVLYSDCNTLYTFLDTRVLRFPRPSLKFIVQCFFPTELFRICILANQ